MTLKGVVLTSHDVIKRAPSETARRSLGVARYRRKRHGQCGDKTVEIGQMQMTADEQTDNRMWYYCFTVLSVFLLLPWLTL